MPISHSFDALTGRVTPPASVSLAYHERDLDFPKIGRGVEGFASPTDDGSVADGHRYPFQVAITSKHASTPGATVSFYSYLYKDFAPTSQTITSLTTEFTLTSTLKVWLNVTVSSLEVTAAGIVTGTSFPSLIVTSGTPEEQTAFNVPIGRVISGPTPTAPGFAFTLSGTAYHFEQLLNSHLITSNLCYNGTPVIYAFPWSGV